MKVELTTMFEKLKRINLVKKLHLEKMQKPAIIIMAVVVLIAINVLLQSVALRFDGSQGKAYTLSNATKKIVKNVDDVVQITFFSSSDLPTRLQPLRTDVRDLLNEYQKENPKRIKVTIADPKKDTSAATKAKDFGVPEVQFSQLEQDKYAVSSSYFGIGLQYADKKEVIPQVTDIESLEYNLTAAIYKLTHKELAKIGVVGGNDANPQATTQSLQQVLAKQFSVESLDISTASAQTAIDKNYKTVVLFDDNIKEYSSEEVGKLSEYLKNGGRVIAFVDGVWVSEALTTEAAKNGLQQLFDEYGLKVNSNLVLSNNAELVNFGNEVVSFLSPYPFWIKTNVFSDKVSYFSNIGQVTLPWVSSITTSNKKGYTVEPLIKSTKQSWEQKGTFQLNPQTIPQPKASDLKEFVVAAQSQNNTNGRLIVVGTSRFVQDRYLSRTSENVEVVLNILNDLASGGALSGIRQRAVNFYPLPDIGENQKDIFKYTTIFILPAILALYGAWRLLRRR